jgi:two-component system, chemotaxis family, response regulator Rcp1
MATARGVLEPPTIVPNGGPLLAQGYATRRPTVLLVEDSPSDAGLWKQALVGSNVTLRVVQTGEMALEFVRRRPPFGNAPPVDLVILDLGLYGTSGFDVLKVLKETTSTAHIPVIVFTGLRDAASVARAYTLHANSYICKPVTLEQFEHVVGLVRRFWIDVVRLPRTSPTF